MKVYIDGKFYDEKQCYIRALEIDPYRHGMFWFNLGLLNGGEVSGKFYDKKQIYVAIYNYM